MSVGDTKTLATLYWVRMAEGLWVFLWGIKRMRKRDDGRGRRLTSNLFQNEVFPRGSKEKTVYWTYTEFLTLPREQVRAGAHHGMPGEVKESLTGKVCFEIRTLIEWCAMLNPHVWCWQEGYKRRYLLQNETDEWRYLHRMPGWILNYTRTQEFPCSSFCRDMFVNH